MNRKIFTLLACALMLFSTAFYVNAKRRVAATSVGDVVKTLPGSSPGMYHIRVDSICLPSDLNDKKTPLIWYPVTMTENDTTYLHYNEDAGNGRGLFELTPLNGGEGGDTILLSVTEDGRVAMIDIGDLRNQLTSEDSRVGLTDLQATMWCVNILDAPFRGQWPTFHFTNKVFGQDLDWMNEGETLLRGDNRGWMYSPSYDNGSLKSEMAFHRHEVNREGYYRVITAELDESTNTTKVTGKLKTSSIRIEDYVNNTVRGMLKFSIVKISPIVLTATDFNTQLGNTIASDTVKLQFDREPRPGGGMEENHFGKKLHAIDSKNPDAQDLGYLNVQVYADNGSFKGYIANSNKNKANDPKKYDNKYTQYLNLLLRNDVEANDSINYNYSYRFVYFPSEDSLVINAYYVKHDSHSTYGDASHKDRGNYASTPSSFYGLYNKEVHDYLIVYLQDLTHVDPVSMMTIGQPANVRIYFGVTSCIEDVNPWKVSQGVYTIWDTKKRCLGVRIYNGSYSPQWIELEDGECPDRIPSYQWVVEHSNTSKNRINIHNREFGDLSSRANDEETFVNMLNILIKKNEAYQIFKYKQLFNYSPIIHNLEEKYEYEPIVNSFVIGQLIPPVPVRPDNDCGIRSESGFRPVLDAFVKDEYLGYKHFYVDSDRESPSFGKSEDIGGAKGMDYNAYAFKYLYYAAPNAYIASQFLYSDSILTVSPTAEDKLKFQFMLGTTLRDRGYKEEIFGYPRTAWGAIKIYDQNGNVTPYTQSKVPVLKRYYYELKVADFYNYRNDLAEEFVVLKGAKRDGSDVKNKLRYGLVDAFGANDPYKFANVYLRESYFLKEEASTNEERNKNDLSRRIYYALLDRIEADQVENVLDLGFEVSDTLWGEDGSSRYNLFSIKVEDARPSILKAQGKTLSSARASVFALENVNEPLYRRLRSIRDDGAEVGKLDAPKVLRLYNYYDHNYFLHEDGLSSNAYNYGINFLGYSNILQNPEEPAPDGMVKYNYNLFIDTAYINRGTGEIKPQYLIAVGTEVFDGMQTFIIGRNPVAGQPENACDQNTDDDTYLETIKLKPYVRGRYLINATDSARTLGGLSEVRDEKYIYNSTWDRLAFVPAIHVDDRLYIVSELESQLEKNGLSKCAYMINVSETEDGEVKTYVNGARLRELADSLNFVECKPDNSARGVFYDFGRWNNFHNDVSFSFRFVQPKVENPSDKGVDKSSNDDKRFYIESETTDRTIAGNKKIAPVKGGWVKLQNFVPVLSRGSYRDAISNGDVFNVAKANMDWQGGKPTSNEEVAGKCYVVAGTDEVAILNAAGKRVTVTNLLGQTLVNKVLNGNNEKISVAKGLVIVNIEGEKAVKAIVK